MPLNACIRETAYQHLKKLYEPETSAVKEKSLWELPQSFRQQILHHISKQIGRPIEAQNKEILLPESLSRLQGAVKKVAIGVLCFFSKTRGCNIGREIHGRIGSVFSEDSNWEQKHVTDDIPLLLQTMHSVLGDLTPELQRILDEWANQGECQEKREAAKLSITSFLRNARANILKLSDLALKSLPDIFDEQAVIFRLYSLDLSSNCFTLFPEQITELQNLMTLSFAENQLRSLPKTIVQLRNLAHLNFYGNQFRSFPEEITQLSKLVQLGFHSNQLTSLPGEISLLRSLELLSFENNPTLKSLPTSLFKLPQSCTVNLAGTGLLEDVINKLQEDSNAPNYKGPELIFSAKHMEHHDEQFKPQKDSNPPNMEHDDEQFKLLSSELTQLNLVQQTSIRSWLIRVFSTANYQGEGKFRKLFIKQMLNNLKEAENDLEFREDLLKSVSFM